MATFDVPANRHAAELIVGVLPDYRRRGLGSRLLALAVGAAESAGRRLLIARVDAPAGDAFLERIGGSMGLAGQVSELVLADADAHAIRSWLERAPVEEFELGLWDGPYPEEALPVVVRMLEAINLAPRGDLEIEDMVWTPEIIRQRDEAMVQRGVERWSLYARHRGKGSVAGYTQVFWNPERPEIVQQADTAVFPEYRGRGIARWLKAAMLERIRRDRPEVRRIRTDNAHSNAAMLRINVEMGFKPLKTERVWQVEVPRARAYLEERGLRT